MLRRVPKDLPLFGALALGLALMAFGYAAMYVELEFGRPSSTASLGFLFIPIWGILAALLGLILGFAVRAFWRRIGTPVGLEKRTWVLAIALGCIIVVSAGAGALDVVRSEQQATPRIRTDTGLLVREFRTDSQAPVRTSETLYDSDREPKGVSWGSNKSELLFGDDRVVLRDTVNGKSVEFLTPALDYITRVDAVSMGRTSGSAPLLAIAVSGRATGRRAVIAVIDENYKVVFEEQLERFWELKQTPMEVRIGAGPGEYVIVGPDCEKSLILRPRNAA